MRARRETGRRSVWKVKVAYPKLAVPEEFPQLFPRMKLAFLATLLFSSLGFAQDKNIATTPDDRLKEGGWKGRHEAKVAQAKTGEAPIVFLGDSITEGWEGQKLWREKYVPMKALNLGFGGDRTEHVLWRIDNGEFDGVKAKLVILLIGTNNIGHNKSNPTQTAEGTKAILARLATKVPDTKILLLGVFPRGKTAEEPLRKQAAEITKLYEGLADGKRVHFLDIGAKFLSEDGTLAKEIMPDALHLSPKGYGIWDEAMAAKVAELMK
jgi:lysophospholipase L1-like esterase